MPIKRYDLRDMKESVFSLDNFSIKEELGFVEAYSKGPESPSERKISV